MSGDNGLYSDGDGPIHFVDIGQHVADTARNNNNLSKLQRFTQQALHKFGITDCLLALSEEASELSAASTRFVLKKNLQQCAGASIEAINARRARTRDDLLEELADVIITSEYARSLFTQEEIAAVVDKKLDKLRLILQNQQPETVTQNDKCVTPNGRTDGHLSYVNLKPGGVVCAFCGKP